MSRRPTQCRYLRAASTSGSPHSGPFLSPRRRCEADRVLDGHRLHDEPAVLVALEVHAMGGDRIDACARPGARRSGPKTNIAGCRPEVLPDSGSRRRSAGGSAACSARRRRRRPRPRRGRGGRRRRPCTRRRRLEPSPPSSTRTRSTWHSARSSSLPARPRRRDVRVQRRLAGVRRAALQAGPALHAVLVGVGDDGLEARAHRVEPARDHARVLGPVGRSRIPRTSLDAVVVRVEVAGAEAARPPSLTGPLASCHLSYSWGRAQRDLRVDRRAAADAAAGEQRDDAAARVAGGHRHPDRPPDVVHRVGLPAGEVRGGPVRADLEEHDVAALRCASSPATTPPPAPSRSTRRRSARLMRPPPGTTSPCPCAGQRERKSISSYAPGPGAPGATKSL